MKQCIVARNDNFSEQVPYNNPDYPFYLTHSFLSEFPNYAAADHWHDDFELIAIISGQMDYKVNEHILHLKEGDGLFVNSKQMHFGFSNDKTECEFLCFVVHPTILCPIASYERDFLLPITQMKHHPYVLLCDKIHWQKKMIDELFFLRQQQEKKERTLPLSVLSSLAAIFTLLHNNLHSIKTELDTTISDSNLIIIKNMVNFIQKNYEHSVTLADIAASGAVGQSKCCQLFARYFSKTPMTYLNHYRLKKSVDLLKHTDLSILEIALLVGFHSASYYAESFRKWIGKSPTSFRRDLH